MLTALAMSGCRQPPVEPLKLERNMLTVDNQSSRDWTQVEIWLNTYYRVTTSSVPAGGRLQAPLDTFVAGYGQRFDFRGKVLTDASLSHMVGSRWGSLLLKAISPFLFKRKGGGAEIPVRMSGTRSEPKFGLDVF